MAAYPQYPIPQQFYPQPMPAPQNFAPPRQQGEFICRSVTCRQEAENAPVDFSCPMILPDLEHGAIYLKAFNAATGGSVFTEFRKAEPAPPVQYVTMDEFNAFREELARKKRRRGDDPDDG